jgi:hypothetical protein
MSEGFEAFTRRVGNFEGLTPTEKLCHAVWYLHNVKGQAHVSAAAVNALFDEMHATPPQSSVYLRRMAEKKPPLLLKTKNGYRLESRPRKDLDDKYGQHASSIQISNLLSSLLDKISSKVEADFLEESLRCYSVGAFRATIVMVWNLAYSHFTAWVYSDVTRLQNFNNSLSVKYPKKNLHIKVWDEFSELKEFEVIEICQHAKIITKNVSDILKEKLKRRNSAAHPSNVVISKAQTDDVITDLINNVVLAQK